MQPRSDQGALTEQQDSCLFFTPQESAQLVGLARKLIAQCGEEWRLRPMRYHLEQLAKEGCFSRDSMGTNGLLRQVEVASCVVEEFHLGAVSTAAILFYRPFQKQFLTLEEIAHFTPSGTTELIERMALSEAIYMRRAGIDATTFRELLLDMAEDLRVVLIILADRLIQLRTAKERMEEERRVALAEEVSTYFVPLAHKLGLYAAKGEMEDLALKYSDPDYFYRIKEYLGETKRSRDAYMQGFVASLHERFSESNHRWPYEIKSRTKSINSIYNKMQNKGVDFHEIFDLSALRIIIDAPLKEEKEACWYFYSMITDAYRPHIERLRDWITQPKANGYESLQITIDGPENKPIEVQIRTRRMDEVAEHGVAAHWRYKGLSAEGKLDASLTNVRSLLESEPSDTLKEQAYRLEKAQTLYIFTPRGQVKKLPLGATVLDFAFAIHSAVGAHATAAKVNGRNVGLKTPLKSGDTVEIVTSKSQAPREDWLHIVVTSEAKNKIRQQLRERREKGLSAARELVFRRLKNRKLPNDDKAFTRAIGRLGYDSYNLFWSDLAEEKVDITHFLEAYEGALTEQVTPQEERLATPEPSKQRQAWESQEKGEEVIVVSRDLKGLSFETARCCNPQYGDPIFAYPSRNGLRIHRYDCPNASDILARNRDRVLPARWSGLEEKNQCNLYVQAADQPELVAHIVSLAKNSVHLSLLSYNISAHNGSIEAELTLSGGSQEIFALRKKIESLPGVDQVSRA